MAINLMPDSIENGTGHQRLTSIEPSIIIKTRDRSMLSATLIEHGEWNQEIDLVYRLVTH